MKNDKNYLKKLIIYKYLPKNKRAFVIPFMRIIINPLFIKLSDSFIEYLFGISKINNIEYEQAKKINDHNNWNSSYNLHKIFEKNNATNVNNLKEKLYNKLDYYIKFYDTDFKEEGNSLNDEEEEEQDNWYDF